MLLNDELVIDFWERTNKVLIDTQLFLLYLVGIIDPSLITSFKRLKAFKGKEVETFEILVLLLSRYPCYTTLPNILTEINSLAIQSNDKAKDLFFKSFAGLLCGEIKPLEKELIEKHIESKCVVGDSSFLLLRLTDTAILKTAEEDGMGIITMDFGLYRELIRRDLPVLNFNHLVPWLK